MLRGFTAFDVFLDQHPEFREHVTFIAQLMPSRTDVPEYAEYLERIEAVVAVVNHRHGTPDWMPIHLKLRDDLEEAVAAYKHYDVLLVNAMFDGMNLVAKEGPLVNERAGVSILSENTGAHEELGEFALSVNPFDIQELADSIHAALTMAPAERERRAAGPRSGSSRSAIPATGSTSSSRTSARRPRRAAAARGARLRPRRAIRASAVSGGAPADPARGSPARSRRHLERVRRPQRRVRQAVEPGSHERRSETQGGRQAESGGLTPVKNQVALTIQAAERPQRMALHGEQLVARRSHRSPSA